MGGLRLRSPIWHGIRAFVGGGAGMAFSLFDVGTLTLRGINYHGSDCQAVFAYQAFLGVNYALNEHANIGLAYHYFSADGSDRRGLNFPAHLDGIELHAISVAFQYSF